MDWNTPIDSYCERLDPGFWAEPVNALSNAFFLLAAFIVWRIKGTHKDRAASILLAILVTIGVGSFLFHTTAKGWSALADTLPILAFILVYLYFATVRFLGQNPLVGGLTVLAYFPFTAAFAYAVSTLWGNFNGSVSYFPVVVLIAGYGVALLRTSQTTAKGLLAGAGILTLSLTFRTTDAGICETFPIGTHFLWHFLNGAMLGWMIVVLMRHKAN